MSSKNKQIWITGTRGFLGKNLKDFLMQEVNCEIKCLSNNKNQMSKLDENFFNLNFQNIEDIKKFLIKNGIPDIFIHIGWGEMTNPHSEKHITSNVESSKNLIDILFKAGLKKFVFIGSLNEYGDQNGSLSEEILPKGKLTNYAIGKIKVSDFGFKSAKITKKCFLHIRLAYVYGSILKENSLIQTLFNGYEKNIDVSVGSCQHFRDYIHVLDAVEGITKICDINQSNIVNLGSGKSIKVRDFVELFWRNLGGKFEKLHFGSEPFRNNEQPQPNCYLDLKKLKIHTNWYPKFSINDGIIQTVNNLKKIK